MSLLLPTSNHLARWFHNPWPPRFFWPGCPCCGNSCASGTISGCTFCDDLMTEAPQLWELTVAGVSNSACSTCADYNGTFCLFYSNAVHPSVACIWDSTQTGTCQAGIRWQLLYNPGADLWALNSNTFDAGGDYSLGGGSFDCEGPNTLSQVSSGDDSCTNWPSTLTIEPGG